MLCAALPQWVDVYVHGMHAVAATKVCTKNDDQMDLTPRY
jgi:hypothetical protein